MFSDAIQRQCVRTSILGGSEHLLLLVNRAHSASGLPSSFADWYPLWGQVLMLDVHASLRIQHTVLHAFAIKILTHGFLSVTFRTSWAALYYILSYTWKHTSPLPHGAGPHEHTT